MFYFDTSFLTPLFREEATSTEVEKFMRGLPVGELALSHWTRVEFASFLAREVRVRGIDIQAATDAGAHFEAITRESFIILLPSADDFNLAREYLGTYETGLRAGDALHLAIARNHQAEAIYSFDKIFLKAGRHLGLPVGEGIGKGGDGGW